MNKFRSRKSSHRCSSRSQPNPKSLLTSSSPSSVDSKKEANSQRPATSCGIRSKVRTTKSRTSARLEERPTQNQAFSTSHETRRWKNPLERSLTIRSCMMKVKVFLTKLQITCPSLVMTKARNSKRHRRSTRRKAKRRSCWWLQRNP